MGWRRSIKSTTVHRACLALRLRGMREAAISSMRRAAADPGLGDDKAVIQQLKVGVLTGEDVVVAARRASVRSAGCL